MDLTPDLLLEAKFAPARRGYDMNEVDDFLERCAEGLDVLLARLRSEFERAERAEAELADVRRGGAPAARPDEPVAEPVAEPASAPEPATDPVAAPTPEPEPVRVEEPMRILIAAERTAEAAVAEARAEAERIRLEAESIASTTRSEAETMLARARADAEAEARRAGDEARRSIESEVLALRQDREVLSADVANLRRWLDDQRTRLRSTAQELQRLVDDPDALRGAPTPELGATSTDADPVDDGDDDRVVDARTASDVGSEAAEAGFDEPGFEEAGFEEHGLEADGADDGEPTQAVPRFGGGIDGPGALFDDERAPSAFTGSDHR